MHIGSAGQPDGHPNGSNVPFPKSPQRCTPSSTPQTQSKAAPVPQVAPRASPAHTSGLVVLVVLEVLLVLVLVLWAVVLVTLLLLVVVGGRPGSGHGSTHADPSDTGAAGIQIDPSGQPEGHPNGSSVPFPKSPHRGMPSSSPQTHGKGSPVALHAAPGCRVAHRSGIVVVVDEVDVVVLMGRSVDVVIGGRVEVVMETSVVVVDSDGIVDVVESTGTVVMVVLGGGVAHPVAVLGSQASTTCRNAAHTTPLVHFATVFLIEPLARPPGFAWQHTTASRRPQVDLNSQLLAALRHGFETFVARLRACFTQPLYACRVVASTQ